MPRVSSSIVAALDRKRDCSDAFTRAIESGEILAQAPQRGKKTWESEQALRKPVTIGWSITSLSQKPVAGLIMPRG
jgi:protein tyrosine/serine phosphatase